MRRCCCIRCSTWRGVKAVEPQVRATRASLSVSLDDIKQFRQLDSRCPGHPEYRWTSGVETTTGPLGQGVATSVGMAIGGAVAGQLLQPAWVRDVRLRRLCALRRRLHDGGRVVAKPRRSRATSSSSNLCWIYDNNRITIEGHTELAFSEDVATRFIAYGWNVTRVGDANDLQMLERAFTTFKRTYGPADPDHRRQPHRLWRRRTSRTPHTAHGEPLGEEESA